MNTREKCPQSAHDTENIPFLTHLYIFSRSEKKEGNTHKEHPKKGSNKEREK